MSSWKSVYNSWLLKKLVVPQYPWITGSKTLYRYQNPRILKSNTSEDSQLQIENTTGIYWKKYLLLSGPRQFKSVLFKSQLYSTPWKRLFWCNMFLLSDGMMFSPLFNDEISPHGSKAPFTNVLGYAGTLYYPRSYLIWKCCVFPDT